MTATDTEAHPLWDARPVLTHIQQFARSRRVAPLAMLGAVLLRAVASVDPKVVLPPTIGGVASLNLFVAFVGTSGLGKGATESAGREATNLPLIPEFPIGSGEGVARTFATNSDGHQEIRSAIFTASEVDGLAALGTRQGATIMAVLRQLYSGEAIGSANAQKHTRLIVDAHTYRAVLSVGVQPERAAPLLSDTAGTAQRFIWLPVHDPDMPDDRPGAPQQWHVPRRLVSTSHQTVLTLPTIATAAMETHHIAKMRGDADVDPLDGHALLTRAKVAAAFMILDGRHGAVSEEDWTLAGHIMATSNRTRARVEAACRDVRKRMNKARALETAERDELIADRQLQRARDAVVRWLGRDHDTELSSSDLRRRARSDWRDQVAPAIAELVDEGVVVARQAASGGTHGMRYRLASGGSTPVHPGPPLVTCDDEGPPPGPHAGGGPVKDQVIGGGPQIGGGPPTDGENSPKSDPVDPPTPAGDTAETNTPQRRQTTCSQCFITLPATATTNVCEDCDDPAHRVAERPLERPLAVVHDGRAAREIVTVCPHCDDPLIHADDRIDGYHTSKTACVRAHRKATA